MSEQTSSPQGEIVKALANIARKITHIGKDRRNQGQGFNFRGIDQVLNTMHDPFAEEGVVVLPSVLDHTVSERTTRNGNIQYHHVMRVEFKFAASDGSWVTCVMVGEAMDSGDKGAAKAMSIALKYAIFQVLLVPVDEQSVEDPDRHTPEDSGKTQKPASQPDQGATEEQKHFIEESFKTLGYNKEDQDKLFDWANADASKGVNGLTAKQATKLVKGLKKKAEELKQQQSNG